MKLLRKVLICAMALAIAAVNMAVPVFAAGDAIAAALDPDAIYGPTLLKNGGFEDDGPWGTCYGRLGVDKGWTTTDTAIERSNSTGTYGIAAPLNGSRYFAEMNANAPAVLYQDLTTKGGDVIRWTLDHAARKAGADLQTMAVKIGAPDGTDPAGTGSSINVHITADTLAVFEYNGITNPTSATYGYGNTAELANLSVARYDSNNQWYTAKGVYLIPEGQTVTRFAFVSTCASASYGNMLDNITFATLIGNLSAVVNPDGSVTVKGYWGDSDTTKKLIIEIGDDTTLSIDMSGVVNNNFKIDIPASSIGDAEEVTVYHQDYASAKRVVKLEHTHVLAYEASGATLSVYCTNTAHARPCTCQGIANAVKLTITAVSKTYDGNPANVKLSDTTAWTGLGLTVPTITYTRTGDAPEETGIFYADTALSGDGTTAPSAPGVYTASITAGGKTASASFTISKQSQSGAPVVTGTKPTTPYAKDGKITGVTDEMEITNDNGATWVKVATGATVAQNLPSGHYIVRYAATDTKAASPCTNVDLFVPAIAVSTDGGATWTEYDDHAEGWKVAIAAGGTQATPVKAKLLWPWTATDGSFGTGGDDAGLNGYICVPSGKYIDLDLNGMAIDGANGTGVIVNKGTLAVSNGTITGGNAAQGGGVNSSGTLLLTDVSLTGNTATKGGGLYTSNSNVTVGGSTTITGNTGGNAYLSTGVTLQVGTGANAPSGMTIGVTTETAPAEGNFVAVTGENASDYSGCFVSDDASLIVLNDSGNVVLLHKHGGWVYTADGATLTATCAGATKCGEPSVSLTISVPATSYVYDGTQKSASLSDTTDWTGEGLTVPTIIYTRTGDAPEETGVFFAEESLGDGDETTAPSMPGEYTASITAGGATASVAFTIYKESQTEAPTGVKGTRPSRVGAEDGKITGLTSDMEVSDDNGETWHQVPEGVTEAKGLPSGKYLVRYAATDTKAASPCVEFNLLRTVATGDETPIVMLAALLAVSMAGIVLIRRKRAGSR